MKSRKSVKRFFLITGTLSCLLLTWIFFVSMFAHYKEGTMIVTQAYLQDAVASTKLTNLSSAGIEIHPTLSDFPQSFQDVIDQLPETDNVVRKYFELNAESEMTPKAYYMMRSHNANGESVLVGKALDWSITQTQVAGVNIYIYYRSLGLSLLFALFFSMLFMFVVRTLIAPLETLKEWATNLATQSDNAAPNNLSFRYSEFSGIASVIEESLAHERVRLKKEKEFLQFASHELRTPLTVMKTNADLLQKHAKLTSVQLGLLSIRIDDSVNEMTRLVETLLWLERAPIDPIAFNWVDVTSMIESLVNEVQVYGIDNYPSITTKLDAKPLCLPEIPTRIALSNLISNAFQYTDGGEVFIEFCDMKVTVRNEVDSARVQGDRGFGLGTLLIERMAKRYHWAYHHSMVAGVYQAELTFSQPSAK